MLLFFVLLFFNLSGLNSVLLILMIRKRKEKPFNNHNYDLKNGKSMNNKEMGNLRSRNCLFEQPFIGIYETNYS